MRKVKSKHMEVRILVTETTKSARKERVGDSPGAYEETGLFKAS
jgi:hypothetical protein